MAWLSYMTQIKRLVKFAIVMINLPLESRRTVRLRLLCSLTFLRKSRSRRPVIRRKRLLSYLRQCRPTSQRSSRSPFVLSSSKIATYVECYSLFINYNPRACVEVVNRTNNHDSLIYILTKPVYLEELRKLIVDGNILINTHQI